MEKNNGLNSEFWEGSEDFIFEESGEKEDFNPFDEEFSVADVVNKRNVIKKEQASKISDASGESFGASFEKSNLEIEDLENYDEEKRRNELFADYKDKTVDVDSILNYDDDKRKVKYFEYEKGVDLNPEPEEEILKKNFKDFLIARKISGDMTGIGRHDYIPVEKVKNISSKVQIEDEPMHEGHETSSHVVIHRNANNDIQLIEVYCSCGEKTAIKFDYEGSAEEDKDTSYIIEKEYIPENFKKHEEAASLFESGEMNLMNDSLDDISALDDYNGLMENAGEAINDDSADGMPADDFTVEKAEGALLNDIASVPSPGEADEEIMNVGVDTFSMEDLPDDLLTPADDALGTSEE